MISRVAESCFWMCRYMERVESTARILAVNRAFVMTANLPASARWRPMVIAVGEEPSFLNGHGEAAMNDGAAVQHYLTWDKDCPVSILTSLKWARENARTIRETVSQEMWRSVNGFWLWLNGAEAQHLHQHHRHRFYEQILQYCQHFMGVCYGTMLREPPYDFMRIGFYAERAGQTARLLDVHRHMLGDTPRSAPAAEESLFWTAVLRSCSAYDMYLRRSRRTLSAESVFRFLVLEPVFPRAIRYALEQVRRLLQQVRPADNLTIGATSVAMATALVARIDGLRHAPLEDLHQTLTDIVDATAELCGAISSDFFNPTASLLSDPTAEADRSHPAP